jgi:hypothetical protein
MCSEIHRFMRYFWIKEELPERWMVSVNVPVYKIGGKTDCSNYRGISLYHLSTTFESIILPLGSTLWLRKITAHYQREFVCNGSTTDRTFCIYQVPEKRRKYSQTVYYFLDSQKAYDSGEKLYSILTTFGIPTEYMLG